MNDSLTQAWLDYQISYAKWQSATEADHLTIESQFSSPPANENGPQALERLPPTYTAPALEDILRKVRAHVFRQIFLPISIPWAYFNTPKYMLEQTTYVELIEELRKGLEFDLDLNEVPKTQDEMLELEQRVRKALYKSEGLEKLMIQMVKELEEKIRKWKKIERDESGRAGKIERGERMSDMVKRTRGGVDELEAGLESMEMRHEGTESLLEMMRLDRKARKEMEERERGYEKMWCIFDEAREGVEELRMGLECMKLTHGEIESLLKMMREECRKVGEELGETKEYSLEMSDEAKEILAKLMAGRPSLTKPNGYTSRHDSGYFGEVISAESKNQNLTTKEPSGEESNETRTCSHNSHPLVLELSDNQIGDDEEIEPERSDSSGWETLNSQELESNEEMEKGMMERYGCCPAVSKGFVDRSDFLHAGSWIGEGLIESYFDNWRSLE